jgi:hypothetical protein
MLLLGLILWQSSFCKVEFVLESLKHSEEQMVEDEEATAAARAAAQQTQGQDQGQGGDEMEVEVQPVLRKQRVSVKHVNKMTTAPPEAPTFSVLSLHVQTLLNPKRHFHEIVAITGILHRAGWSIR